MSALVEVSHLTKHFTQDGGPWRRGARITAVNDVTFAIEEGEMFGLVGESGSGKTTLGRCLLRLLEPSSGEVRYRGEDVLRATAARMRALRREMQVIFQDPYSSLDPRMRAVDIVTEPLVVHHVGTRDSRRTRAGELLALVGLEPGHLDRYPHEFSGGQRQRLAIARALALEPSFIVADEAVSSLDLSMQAQVVGVLAGLQARLGLTCLFIAHDLRLVSRICSRVAVMYRGRLVEMGPANALFARPAHPYTRALLSAIPSLDPDAPRARVPFDPATYDPGVPLRLLEPQHWACV